MRFIHATALIGITAVTGYLGCGQAKAESMMDRMVLSRCTSAMTSDFAKAGQTPPDGLVDKTCQCVLKTYKATNSIATAKQTCSQQAKQELPQTQASETSKPKP